MELDYNDFIEINESPFALTIEAYNEDDTYDHTFRIGIGVMPRWVLLPQEMLSSVMQGTSDILAGMAKWLGVKRVG